MPSYVMYNLDPLGPGPKTFALFRVDPIFYTAPASMFEAEVVIRMTSVFNLSYRKTKTRLSINMGWPETMEYFLKHLVLGLGSI